MENIYIVRESHVPRYSNAPFLLYGEYSAIGKIQLEVLLATVLHMQDINKDQTSFAILT